MSRRFFAHTHRDEPQPGSKWQELSCHLQRVTELAESFAAETAPIADVADIIRYEESMCFRSAVRAAALLHDYGKYQADFQSYLNAVASGHAHRKIPHAPVGAAKAFRDFGIVHGFAPAGHHQGLPDRSTLNRYLKEWGAVAARIEPDANVDCIALKSFSASKLPGSLTGDFLRVDVFVRMLFSCLVDADWCDTNAWKESQSAHIYEPVPLEPVNRLADLERHLQGKIKEGPVNAIRRRVQENCQQAAQLRPGFFSLTVPTGGGKTLASLAFALRHCAAHEAQIGPRRIIYVIPFLNVIEQTAKEFYEVLGVQPGDGIVLEHHSLAYADRPQSGEVDGQPRTNSTDEEDENPIARRMEENWEAPIVITTSVQFFESLFSNRPAAARKLHNIARSVVIFDECQTFPIGLYRPTLGTLKELVRHWGVSFVFCTATQPVLREREEFRFGIPLNELHEIMQEPNPDELFRQMHRTESAVPRVRVTWPRAKDDIWTWQKLAENMRTPNIELVAKRLKPQALGIVNFKAHARRLFEALGGKPGDDCPDGIFVLSTLMCAAHRKFLLKEIKRRLNSQTPPNERERCLVAATQLVEAGVDFDFPAVFRAFGPLDSIGQAAGRCNREGKLMNSDGSFAAGNVTIFRPVREPSQRRDYPTKEYESAAAVTEHLVVEAKMAGLDGPDIFRPQTFEKYFTILTSLRDTDVADIEALRQVQDFPKVAMAYRLIDENTTAVIVPFSADGKKENSPVQPMLSEIRSRGFATMPLARRLQPYLVNLWPHEFEQAKWKGPIFVQQIAEGWWEWIGRYDLRCGLMFELDDLPIM